MQKSLRLFFSCDSLRTEPPRQQALSVFMEIMTSRETSVLLTIRIIGENMSDRLFNVVHAKYKNGRHLGYSVCLSIPRVSEKHVEHKIKEKQRGVCNPRDHRRPRTVLVIDRAPIITLALFAIKRSSFDGEGGRDVITFSSATSRKRDREIPAISEKFPRSISEISPRA